LNERERRRKLENLRMIVIDLDLLARSSEPLGASVLKEGAVGAVGEWSPQEKPSHKKTSQAETSKRKER
jgi:hypothetical protein